MVLTCVYVWPGCAHVCSWLNCDRWAGCIRVCVCVCVCVCYRLLLLNCWFTCLINICLSRVNTKVVCQQILANCRIIQAVYLVIYAMETSLQVHLHATLPPQSEWTSWDICQTCQTPILNTSQYLNLLGANLPPQPEWTSWDICKDRKTLIPTIQHFSIKLCVCVCVFVCVCVCSFATTTWMIRLGVPVKIWNSDASTNTFLY